MLKKDYPREYSTWRSMKQRCFNKNNKHYKNYGLRGITVCKRWVDDFWCFLEDMGNRPDGDYSIERKDNGKGYSPGNCKWASRFEQSRNHRRNHLLEHEGITKHLTDWAMDIGITQQALQDRIKKMPVDVALSMPANPDKKRYIKAHGKMLTLDGWAKELGINKSTVHRRLKMMPPDTALRIRSKKDSDNGIAKRSVRQLTIDGEVINIYYSLSQAGRVTGVNFKNIQSVCSGRCATAGGFRWEYLN